jgi:ACS family glucarate transporter-like MFS transporter
MPIAMSSADRARGRIRFTIVAMLFAITMVNYADRATLAITGPVISKDLGFTHVQMGFIFSAFGWSYVIGQLPGGWLLDRFGSKAVYFLSIVLWSFFTLLQGGVWMVGTVATVYALFALRFMVGFAEAPSFPANGRIVAAWYPANERGTASAIFNSAQYFATVVFAPVMGFITVTFGWPYVFYFMGALGIVMGLLWLNVIYSPKQHPHLRPAELDYIASGGGLVNLDQPGDRATGSDASLGYLKQLLQNRMMLGIYLGQFCISAITYFFITWFPVYLVRQRGMSILNAGLIASIPAICGFSGGVLGGVWSDFLLRRGWSLTASRKIPIVAGMLLSMSMIVCNYADAQWLVVGIMALAFFGKGIGALGWAVISDAAPKQIAGLSGALFNMFGNISSITTPIVIGYILQATGSFNGALVFIGANAAVAILSYVVVVGEIKRMELKPRALLGPKSINAVS